MVDMSCPNTTFCEFKIFKPKSVACCYLALQLKRVADASRLRDHVVAEDRVADAQHGHGDDVDGDVEDAVVPRILALRQIVHAEERVEEESGVPRVEDHRRLEDYHRKKGERITYVSASKSFNTLLKCVEPRARTKNDGDKRRDPDAHFPGSQKRLLKGDGAVVGRGARCSGKLFLLNKNVNNITGRQMHPL